MEVGVLRRLAAEAGRAGRDPADRPDPGPDPRRPVRVPPPTRRPVAGTAPAGSSTIAPSSSRRPARSTSAAACRSTSVRIGSTRSGSPRRAMSITGSSSAGPGDTARCRGPDNAAVRAAAVVDPAGGAGTDPPRPGHGSLLRDGGRRDRRSDRRPRPADRVRRRRDQRDRDRARSASTRCTRRAVRALLRDTASPECHQGRGQVQRHPGRRRDRGRLPDAAGDRRGGHDGRAPPRGSASDLLAHCEIEAFQVGAGGRGLRTTRICTGSWRRRCATTTGRASPSRCWRRSPRMPSTWSGSGSRRTASPRSVSSRANGSSSGSTGSTSGSASMRSGSACRSSTTSFGGTAAEASSSSRSRTSR